MNAKLSYPSEEERLYTVYPGTDEQRANFDRLDRTDRSKADAERLKWDEDENGQGTTAMCPGCGIDAVIGSESGYPITEEFLTRMNENGFKGS